MQQCTNKCTDQLVDCLLKCENDKCNINCMAIYRNCDDGNKLHNNHLINHSILFKPVHVKKIATMVATTVPILYAPVKLVYNIHWYNRTV